MIYRVAQIAGIPSEFLEITAVQFIHAASPRAAICKAMHPADPKNVEWYQFCYITLAVLPQTPADDQRYTSYFEAVLTHIPA